MYFNLFFIIKKCFTYIQILIKGNTLIEYDTEKLVPFKSAPHR